MDRERIEKELESMYPRKERYHDNLCTVSVCYFAEHVAIISRKEALEEALKICKNEYDAAYCVCEIKELLEKTNESI